MVLWHVLLWIFHWGWKSWQNLLMLFREKTWATSRKKITAMYLRSLLLAQLFLTWSTSIRYTNRLPKCSLTWREKDVKKRKKKTNTFFLKEIIPKIIKACGFSLQSDLWKNPGIYNKILQLCKNKCRTLALISFKQIYSWAYQPTLSSWSVGITLNILKFCIRKGTFLNTPNFPI